MDQPLYPKSVVSKLGYGCLARYIYTTYAMILLIFCVAYYGDFSLQIYCCLFTFFTHCLRWILLIASRLCMITVHC